MASFQVNDLILDVLAKVSERYHVVSSIIPNDMHLFKHHDSGAGQTLSFEQFDFEADEDDYVGMVEIPDSNFRVPFDTVFQRFYEGDSGVPYQLGETKNIPYWSETISFTNDFMFPSYGSDNFSMSPVLGLASPPVSWGPCYPPKDENEVISWESTSPNVLKEAFDQSNIIKATDYTSSVGRQQSDEDEDVSKFCADDEKESKEVATTEDKDSLHGMCRPGFLIIGAGKCGTSSLYHYVVQHPKVAPARQKQIGFFKYFLDKGLKCYLSFFPSTEEFVSSGALITGEAFPGYLPYPNVAPEVRRLLGADGPRIIVSVREPLSRAYSSYKYNYQRMGLKILRERDEIPRTDEFYKENYLFTFEEMIRAELEYLKECLAPGGKAEILTFQKYGQRTTQFTNSSIPSYNLIDVEQCYAPSTDNETSSPHEGYHLSKLMERSPEKIIDIPQTNHLIRSMLARGMYILSMDWWYATFEKSNIHVVCLEELSRSRKAMDDVTKFLGLPEFDFTSIISKERYNVGGNEGFTSLTRTDEVIKKKRDNKIPVSEELRKDVQDFFSFYNELLFERIGRRCSW